MLPCWFSDSVSKKVKNGISVMFWTDIWLGACCFKDLYSRLYRISDAKDSVQLLLIIWGVGRMINGDGIGVGGGTYIVGKRNWKGELQNLVSTVVLSKVVNDLWVCGKSLLFLGGFY